MIALQNLVCAAGRAAWAGRSVAKHRIGRYPGKYTPSLPTLFTLYLSHHSAKGRAHRGGRSHPSMVVEGWGPGPKRALPGPAQYALANYLYFPERAHTEFVCVGPTRVQGFRLAQVLGALASGVEPCTACQYREMIHGAVVTS